MSGQSGEVERGWGRRTCSRRGDARSVRQYREGSWRSASEVSRAGEVASDERTLILVLWGMAVAPLLEGSRISKTPKGFFFMTCLVLSHPSARGRRG